MKSILSEQREADEAQLRVLECAALGLSSEDPYNYLPRGVSAGHALWAAARIRALSADLQEACHERDGLMAKVPEWQPIETAPKDGTWFLGYWPDCEYPENRFSPTRWDDETIDGARFIDTDDWRDWCQPTNWMPLPTPPGEK